MILKVSNYISKTWQKKIFEIDTPAYCLVLSADDVWHKIIRKIQVKN